jgi:hypothetical protein
LKKLALLVMAAVAISFIPGTVTLAAEEVPEHPLIRPFPGSVMAQNMSKYMKYDAFEFSVTDPETGKTEKVSIKGEYRRLLYEVFKENGERNTDISHLEFYENFKAAALEQGGEVRLEEPLVSRYLGMMGVRPGAR